MTGRSGMKAKRLYHGPEILIRVRQEEIDVKIRGMPEEGALQLLLQTYLHLAKEIVINHNCGTDYCSFQELHDKVIEAMTENLTEWRLQKIFEDHRN
jgi:hypothetical protein